MARFRSVWRMSRGTGQDGYRTIAIAVEEARGPERRPTILTAEEDEEVTPGAPALGRLIEVGGWPCDLSFSFSFSTLLGNAL